MPARRYTCPLLLALLVLQIVVSYHVVAAEQSVSSPGKLSNLFSNLKTASQRSFTYAGDLLTALPVGKIFLAGGALLSLLFIFVRLLIVLGPIILLGALTRESTDASDLLRMLIEFYNQVVIALDEQSQQSTSQGPS